MQAAFAKVRESKAKFDAKDIPAATQLFTPEWIVRFLVQNTLGRLWVGMHPDSRLVGAALLDYLVPPAPPPPGSPAPRQGRKGEGESVRSVRDITLLDPASGTMHFGLVAFDLFAAMYAEEIERAGEPGWPAAPPVGDPGDIPAAILAHNLHGIDIDLRATQLSALALWLRAKRMNPRAELRAINLACADVRPLNGERLGVFLKEMEFSPLTARLIRELWDRLKDADHLGSLLRLEGALSDVMTAAQDEYRHQPLLARMEAGYGSGDGTIETDFWETLEAQVEQGLDLFVKEQAERGFDQRFFAGEALKGLHLLDLMRRRYDVVVTNPPYLNRRKMNERLMKLLDARYPATKSDFYAAFIERCLEYAKSSGHVGMLTMHSFMFISSYEQARHLFREKAGITTLAHLGPGLFDVGNPGTLQTVAFTLRAEPDRAAREANIGTYFRLVHAPTGDDKRRAFEAALAAGEESGITYHLPQSKFDAIPGAPWVYWVNDRIRRLFVELPSLGEVAQPRQGLATADNFRFLRFWWEIGVSRVAIGCRDTTEAQASLKRWFPYMKGGGFKRWYGNNDATVNWNIDGMEIRNLQGDSGRIASRPQNTDYYFKEGITYSYLTSASFSARISPGGFVFDVAGSSLFPADNPTVLSILNSPFAAFTLGLINPTVNFQVGDLARLPIVQRGSSQTTNLVQELISLSRRQESEVETTYDFTFPLEWGRSGQPDLDRQNLIEARLTNEVYTLYKIESDDIALIESELASQSFNLDEADATNDGDDEDSLIVNRQSEIVNQEDLAIRWISYAIGVVLGRFSPGTSGALGRAVYRREDFAVGSLPAPDEAEFDQLVGPAARFAYIDDDGGRHVFARETEAALRALALKDGIAVLDPGHPRDLPALVERALDLMLGPAAAEEVTATGAGGDLRRFLSKDYFTRYHFSWYRKRPVYWPLQSAGRAYGFVVFHEKIGTEAAASDFLYVLLSDYLTQKQRALATAIEDARGRVAGATGAARRAAEREQAALNEQLVEVSDFARTIKRLADGGYRPAENWIDDGVILRLAPIHELIPLWKAEPKKHWDRLQRGDFDWSHIAMHYWPERVKEKCRTNKSFAIAHGM